MCNDVLHCCLCCWTGVQDVTVISEDGSPHGPKCFVLWNPPLTHMDAKKVRL